MNHRFARMPTDSIRWPSAIGPQSISKTGSVLIGDDRRFIS